MDNLVAHDRLLGLLAYDPLTGDFCWKVTPPRGRVKAGDIAGCDNGNGYRLIIIDGQRYYAHRLAWFYMTGVWPPDEIDHINCQRSDNRFANLRLATSVQNKSNIGRAAHNTSGFKGVSYDHLTKRWYAYISVDNRKRHIGVFDDPQLAHAAYAREAIRERGEFARTQ